MARETDVLLEHSADGIREYDNPMPAWWLGILYGSIVFAIFFVPYLYMTGWTSTGQYDEEMAAAAVSAGLVAEAAERQAALNPPPAPVDGAPASVLGDSAAGKEVWTLRCVACHKEDGTGSIGPNLTDAEWIHGGTPEAIVKTITEGVPAKGMLAWGPIIGDEAIRDVAAYVHAFGGGQ